MFWARGRTTLRHSSEAAAGNLEGRKTAVAPESCFAFAGFAVILVPTEKMGGNTIHAPAIIALLIPARLSSRQSNWRWRRC